MKSLSVRSLAALVSCALSVSAQTVAPSSVSPVPKEEEAVKLSPFEITAESDSGYVGQNTLAGSRLRTQLRDVAAAISPMTAEFLADLAITNLVEASEYAINTRVETDDGRAAGPVADGYNNSIREFRVRGLPGAGRTLNFVPYLGEADAFNTERIEINRGPNSILYGIGSPAGVINVATKQARTDRRAQSVSLRMDSWGGVRATGDVNMVLLPGKLALRTVYLHGREKSWRAAGHNDQDRLFITSTWRPSRRTNVRAEFEGLEQDRYVPRPFFGVDLTGAWDAAGRPTFSNFSATAVPGTLGAPGDPFRDTGATALNGVVELRDGPYIVLSPQFPFAQDYRRFTRSEPTPGPIRNDFARGRSNPRADLQANWMGGDWKNRRGAVIAQQEIAQGLNAEVAVSHQKQTYFVRDIQSWNFYGIQGDPNIFYPDGTLKPAGNQYYFETTKAERPGFDTIDYGRITLSYEKEVGRLGELRLAGLGEMRKTETKTEILQEYLLNGPEVSSGGAYFSLPEDARNTLNHRSYISNLADLNNPDFRIPGPMSVAGGIRVKDPATGALRTVYSHMINRSQGNINWFEQDNTTAMLAGQFYTLRNRLVLTGGYRRDDVKRFQSNAIRDPRAVAPNVGVWIPVAPPSSPSSQFEGKTYTYGGVLHVTPWLSGFYNHANSINPPSTIRIVGSDPSSTDLLGLTAPLRSGVTDDYGLKLSLVRDRLYLTATRFETTAVKDTGFSGFGFSGSVRNIWQALRDSTLLTPAQQATASDMFNYTSAVQGYLYDSKTEGYELEVVGTIVPGWSVSLNVSQTESVWSNVASEARAYIDYWSSPDRGALSWTAAQNVGLSLTQSTATPGPDYRTAQDFRVPADIRSLNDFTLNTDTVGEQLVDLENNLFNNPFVFEGRRFIGDNKYNMNLRTRYDFQSGEMKGLSVGAGMRLRKNRIAGAVSDFDLPSDTNAYLRKANGRTVKSTRLTEATDQAIFDLQVTYRPRIKLRKLGWTIQLNVNNLTDEDEFIVNNAHPSTGEPVTYRYQDPRQIIVTNTFSF